MFREIEFKALCNRYSDDIYRYSLSLLGNSADAQDATQEVLLRVWRQLPKIHIFNAKAWLLQITRNYCLDQLRRRASRPALVLVADEVLTEHPDDSTPCPSEGTDADFLIHQIMGALMTLPETQRSVFMLHEVNGLRYREIAKTLSLPLNTVKVYLSRAREKLKDRLTQHQSWIKR